MKLALQNNNLGGQILYKSHDPVKKRRQKGLISGNFPVGMLIEEKIFLKLRYARQGRKRGLKLNHSALLDFATRCLKRDTHFRLLIVRICMVRFFRLNFHFSVKFVFSSTYRFFVKISMFRQNFLLFVKISIFGQNFFFFLSKFRFFNKISFFRQNFIFSSKTRFFNKISFFRQNFDFSPKISFFFDKISIFR